MSLESGRKLGLTASLIAIIVPIITVAFYALLIFSLIASFATSAMNGGSSTLGSSLFPYGLIILLITLGIAGLIGFISFILAMYHLSQHYNEPGIFRNILYSLITIIVGAIAMGAILVALILATRTISTVGTPSTVAPAAGAVIASFLGVVAAFFVIGIVGAFFVMRAFNKLGEKSGEHNFNTAGLLFLVGAIIPVVGGFIGWIAWIFAAMGFNALKPKPTETTTFANSTPQTTPPVMTQKRFCPYCGIENTPESIYCVVCGKKLQ